VAEAGVVSAHPAAFFNRRTGVMDSKGANLAKAILAAVILCGALPFAAYLVSLAIFGDAILVGPFLLVSPILAMWVAGAAFSLCYPWFQRRNREVPDPTLSDLANQFGSELGIPRVDVYLQPNQANDYFCPVLLHGTRVDVRSDQWLQLSKGEREFAMAQPLANKAVGRRPWTALRWQLISLLFLCAVGASQSLWFIIPAQSLGAVWLMFANIHYMKTSTLAADRRALDLTRDLRSATSYLDRRAGKSSPPWLKYEERIEKLGSAASELGIA